MTIELTGDQTTAQILVDSPESDLVESNVIDQIQELIDHPAFTEPVRMMPDTHLGSGAPIGFTMPLGEKIVPNIVGVDVGCGMAATNLGSTLPLDHADRDTTVRNVVPMGRSVHPYEQAPHLINEFPFERANRVFEQFNAAYKEKFGDNIDPLNFDFNGYDGTYFKSLCRRVLGGQAQGMGHVIKSAGTLGGGNHFIEFAQARDTDEYWLIVHTGSRYLGKSVAEYWQQQASCYRSADSLREVIPRQYTEYLKFDPETVSDRNLNRWVTGGMGESHLRKEQIRADFDEAAANAVFEQLSNPQRRVPDRNTSLDWLSGREGHGYFVDMLFAQQYARWNRTLITNAICDALNVTPSDSFQSIHNYIDFRDLTIRKGATPAREDQRIVIPFNMAVGSILARGTGNPQYNQSAPHGAGRRLSRGDAYETVSIDDFEQSMDGVYSESVIEAVRDEAPMAYKPADAIAEALEPTADITDRLDVVHNLKIVE